LNLQRFGVFNGRAVPVFSVSRTPETSRQSREALPAAKAMHNLFLRLNLPKKIYASARMPRIAARLSANISQSFGLAAWRATSRVARLARLIVGFSQI